MGKDQITPVKEESFDLEDIIREFGTPAEKTEAETGSKTESRREAVPKKETAPKKEKVPGGDGTPIGAAAPVEKAVPGKKNVSRAETAPKAEPAPKLAPEPSPEAISGPAPESKTEPTEKMQARREEGHNTVSYEAFQEGRERFKKKEETARSTPAQRSARGTESRIEPEKKKRTVVPPEIRYQNSLKQMSGRKIRLVLCWMLTIAALAEGIFRSEDLLSYLPQQSMFGFGEIAVLILCALCAWDVLKEGITQLPNRGFTLYTLTVVETAAGLLQGFMLADTGTGSLCPLICLNLSCALWGWEAECRADCAVMEAVRKADGRRALVREKNLYGKLPVLLQGQGHMGRFLEEYDRTPAPTKFLNLYGLVILAVSLILSALTGDGNAVDFLSRFLVIQLAGTSLCLFLAWSRPWGLLSWRISKKYKAAFYGWNGICGLSGKLAIRVSDQDLFPGENLKLNGVKYFGGADPDRVAAYGAAVMEAAGSGLAPIFAEQLRIRGGRRYAVTQLRRYETGGVSADIGPESVLVGSLPFIQSMGVEVPAGTKVSQAVYIAIDSELQGVFAIHYGVHRGTVEAMTRLSSCHSVVPVVTAGDFMITEAFLKAKFHVDSKRVQLPSLTARTQLNEKRATKDAQPCALIQSGAFEAAAVCLSGARALRAAAFWGIAIAVLGSLVGMGIMGVLLYTAGLQTVTLTKLLLFLVIWAVPGYLLTGWTRNI